LVEDFAEPRLSKPLRLKHEFGAEVGIARRELLPRAGIVLRGRHCAYLNAASRLRIGRNLLGEILLDPLPQLPGRLLGLPAPQRSVVRIETEVWIVISASHPQRGEKQG